MAAATVETIWKPKFKLISYPAYSPDHTTSDYVFLDCSKHVAWTHIYK